MGLFDLFKKKQQPEAPKESKVLLAMPMFVDGQRHDIPAAVQYLHSHWGLEATSMEGDSDTVVLSLAGETVVIAFMPMPIPAGDLEGTAPYAYNWPNVLEDIKDHTGHALVTVMASNKSMLEQYTLFTKVLHALVATSEAVGVYQGSQSLLIPRQQYLDQAMLLKEGRIPVPLWLYVGLRKGETGNSVYTYGLTQFGKQEMEVINASMDLEALYSFVLNIAAYVIGQNVTFQSGETLGYTAEQKVKISASKGHFVQGESLKLAF